MPPANPKNYQSAAASDLGLGNGTSMEDEEERRKKMLQQRSALTPMGYAAQALFPNGGG